VGNLNRLYTVSDLDRYPTVRIYLPLCKLEKTCTKLDLIQKYQQLPINGNCRYIEDIHSD